MRKTKNEILDEICAKLLKRSEFENRIRRSRIFWKLHLFKRFLTLKRLTEQKDYFIWRCRNWDL